MAVVSLAVFGGLGYGWAVLNKADGGLSRAHVIDPGAQGSAGPKNILMVGIVVA